MEIIQMEIDWGVSQSEFWCLPQYYIAVLLEAGVHAQLKAKLRARCSNCAINSGENYFIGNIRKRVDGHQHFFRPDMNALVTCPNLAAFMV